MTITSLDYARYAVNNIVPVVRESLTVDNIDFSTIITNCAINAARGSEILFGGMSRAGHIGSMKRIGRRMYDIYKTDEFLFKKIGVNHHFGGQAVGINVHKNVDITVFTEPEREAEMRSIYLESPHCREGEFKNLLDATRGLYLGNLLGDKLSALNTRGSAYLRKFIEDYEANRRSSVDCFLADCEMAGLMAC